VKITHKKRTKPFELEDSKTPKELELLSQQVRYIGSGIHKRGKNPLAPYQWNTKPSPGSSICPQHIKDEKIVTEWLRTAVKKGAITKNAKRVWYIGVEGIFEAMSSNNNEYHGYPITDDELPPGVKELYGQL
jgi:hypothetical protein